MGSFDIKIAFDAQQHDELHKALENNNTPTEARMATAQDYTDKTAKLCITETVQTDEIPFTQGGWQGGTRTPDEFNAILHNIYTKTITKWREEGVGYHIEGRECNHFIWADNIILIANNLPEMQRMLDDLTTNTLDAKFMWKEGEIMAGGDLVDDKGNLKDNLDPDAQTISTWIADKNDTTKCNYETLPIKTEITLLGTRLHYTGNSTRSMEHRLAKAENTFWRHYQKLKKQTSNTNSTYG